MIEVFLVGNKIKILKWKLKQKKKLFLNNLLRLFQLKKKKRRKEQLHLQIKKEIKEIIHLLLKKLKRKLK